ncbi:MAG: GNAT family N-acetyltransferase [Cyclonatronaceae bacterium]
MNSENKLECISLKNDAKAKPEPTKKPSTIKHRVIQSETEFDELKTEWNLLCEYTNSHVFQTYEWNRSWWKHFGFYGKLQIFVLYDDDNIVGIAPLFIDEYTLFGLKTYTILRMIGSGIGKTKDGVLLGSKAYSDYLQFVIQKGYETSFYEHLMAHIKKEVLFDAMILEEIPELSSTLELLENDFASLGFKVNIKKASITTRIEPEQKGWDGYLKKLSGNERKNVRKSIRKTENTGENVFRVVVIDDNIDFEYYLKQFIQLHQDQWNREGLPGTFSQNSMKKFFLETCEKLLHKASIRVYALLPAEETGAESAVSIAIVMIYNNQMYLQHGAMDLSSPLIHIGPGKILNTIIIKDSVQSGLTFDFLRGDEVYKQRLATKINQNITIEISSESVRQILLKKMVDTTQSLKKRYANELVRKDIVTKNHSSIVGWYHYSLFLSSRLASKLNIV